MVEGPRGVSILQNSSKKFFRLIFTVETELEIFTADSFSLLLLFLLPDNSSFFCSLKVILIETCSRTSIVAKLRPRNGLGQNGFSYVKKVIPGSLSPGILYPIYLYFWNHVSCGHLSEGYTFLRLNLEIALVKGGVSTSQSLLSSKLSHKMG